MKKLKIIFSIVFILMAFGSFAQDVKFKKGDILIDGLPALAGDGGTLISDGPVLGGQVRADRGVVVVRYRWSS